MVNTSPAKISIHIWKLTSRVLAFELQPKMVLSMPQAIQWFKTKKIFSSWSNIDEGNLNFGSSFQLNPRIFPFDPVFNSSAPRVANWSAEPCGHPWVPAALEGAQRVRSPHWHWPSRPQWTPVSAPCGTGDFLMDDKKRSSLGASCMWWSKLVDHTGVRFRQI